MTCTVRQQLLVDYLAATDNEIAVDEMLLSMAHTTSERVGYLPRVSRWVGKAKQYPVFSRSVWRLLWLVWLCGGALLFFGFELLRFERLRDQTKKRLSEGISLTDGAVLALSTRACEVIRTAQFPGLPTTWLTLPWAPQQSLPEGAQELALMKLVSRCDLLRACRDAVHATYMLAKDSKRAKWVLQSYTAFRWFLVRGVVDRISGTLVIAEHFDRWAVLVDRSVQSACMQSMAKRMVLIQHGALGGLSAGSHAVSIKPFPTLLTSVHELYAYSSEEEGVFRSSIMVGNGSPLPLAVHYFRPLIDLLGPTESVVPRILFVGHPLCEEFQVSVFKALQKLLHVEAFYKPHPKAPMSASMATIGWKVIDNPRHFPCVELIISYPSTLVIEYEGVGVRASVHPLDIKSDSLEKFIDQTLRMLVPSA